MMGDALRQALLGAKTIYRSEGASGTHVAQIMLKKLGIAEQVAGKTRQLQDAIKLREDQQGRPEAVHLVQDCRTHPCERREV